MPNPYGRHSRHRTGSRRAQNWRLEKSGMSECGHCHQTKAPHTVCPHCGFYNGKLVVPKKEKKSKKAQAEGQQGEEKEGK
jgi:large subunit ribosomal protein L32